MEFEHLFQPFQLGPLRLRNRIFITGHTTGYIDENQHPDERAVHYYRERSKGGAALMFIGHTTPHPSGPLIDGVQANWDDRIIPRYRAIADAVHEFGGLIMTQLSHYGQRSGMNTVPLWAPSAIRIGHLPTPHAMDRQEIHEVIDGFESAAHRVVAGGLDGIELNIGHGLLTNEFLSPLSNHRTDEYGGSLENRMRFCFESLQAVRRAVGRGFVVGMRMNGEDLVAGGLTQADWLEIARQLEATGLVDYLNVSADFQGSVIPPMYVEQGHYVPYAQAVKRAVKLPVFCAIRIVDPRHAEEILAQGWADMVGMTRAHIADPHLVNKAHEGRLDDIRPCVGCLQMCVGELARGHSITCIYNPVTGHEQEWAQVSVAATPKRVVVVGGGPAGLEAARVAAIRGHSVVLFERQDRLGGLVHAAARAPDRAEFEGITRWLSHQVEQLGVDVRLGIDATAERILADAPDAVILATGSVPIMPQWASGADIPIIAARDVWEGCASVGDRVLVVDEEGHIQGCGTADLLVQQGKRVTILSPRLVIGEDLERGNLRELYRRLLSAGVTMLPHTRVVGFHQRDVIVSDVFSETESRLTGIDTVITTESRGDDSLHGPLRGQVKELFMAGDCIVPRKVDSAVREAFELSRTL